MKRTPVSLKVLANALHMVYVFLIQQNLFVIAIKNMMEQPAKVVQLGIECTIMSAYHWLHARMVTIFVRPLECVNMI